MTFNHLNYLTITNGIFFFTQMTGKVAWAIAIYFIIHLMIFWTIFQTGTLTLVEYIDYYSLVAILIAFAAKYLYTYLGLPRAMIQFNHKDLWGLLLSLLFYGGHVPYELTGLIDPWGGIITWVVIIVVFVFLYLAYNQRKDVFSDPSSCFSYLFWSFLILSVNTALSTILRATVSTFYSGLVGFYISLGVSFGSLLLTLFIHAGVVSSELPKRIIYVKSTSTYPWGQTSKC